jgi:hypothetical protein
MMGKEKVETLGKEEGGGGPALGAKRSELLF